jgi:hypothetical protein
LHLGYHGNGRHFEFVQPKKLPYTTVDKKIGISRTNFAAVAMEIKSGDFNFFFISFIKLHKNDHSRLLAKLFCSLVTMATAPF